MAADRTDPAAEIVAELLDRARDGTLDAAWIEAHVQPAPVGWTAATRSTWLTVFAPDGPLVAALRGAAGVVHVSRGRGPVRVVVEGAPLLVFTVEGDPPRIVSVEPTTCVECDEAWRFVSDLLADIRRRGTVTPRLLPGVELDVSGVVAAFTREERAWPAALDAYVGNDARLRRLLLGAVVLRQEGDVVHVRYSDGRVDTWRILLGPRGGRVDYAALAPDSPLRLEGAAVARWRPRAEARLPMTWTPELRLRPDRAGQQLGRGVLAADLDGIDGTVLVATMGPDGRTPVAIRMLPETGEVLARYGEFALSAREDPRAPAPAPPGSVHARLDPSRRRLAVAVGDALRVLDVGDDTAEAVRRTGHDAPIRALDWSPDGALLVGLHDGRVFRGGALVGAIGSAVLAVTAASEGVEVVGSDGVVRRLGPEGAVEVLATTCDGDAIAAAHRERDGTWLVACGPSVAASHDLALPMSGPVLRRGERGAPAGAVAWSGDGRHYLVPAPEGGSVLWNDAEDRPEARMGRMPLREVTFAPEGDDVLGVTVDGDVVWWHLPTVRRLHPVLPERSEE